MTFHQTGGCQCGAVCFEITAPPNLAYTCHCTDCQRLTGSAFSMGLVVAAEAFHPSGGETRPFERTTESGRISTHWVCARCGTWICGGPKPGIAEPGTLVIVRAGTLDDTSWLRPVAHFWTRSAQPWLTLPEGTPRSETQPPDFGWMRSPRAVDAARRWHCV